jgi:hypothetical protein
MKRHHPRPTDFSLNLTPPQPDTWRGERQKGRIAPAATGRFNKVTSANRPLECAAYVGEALPTVRFLAAKMFNAKNAECY